MKAMLAERAPLTDWRILPLIPRFTAFLAIAAAARDPGRLVLGLVVTLIVFASDRWARNGWFWIGLSAVVGYWNFTDWHHIDNHIWLAAYWYLALGLALLTDDPERSIARSARLLIGFVFVVAIIRKVVNVEFLNGDFFVFTLLVDPRFESVATLVGGASSTAGNHAAVGALPDPAILVSGSGVRPIAIALTVGTVVVEAAAGIFNLLPVEKWRRAGQVSLVAFIVVTYFIVPVVAFGAALIVMGAASASSEVARRRWVLVFFALAVWGFVWQGYSL